MTRVSGTMDSDGTETLAGISVDAVREQLGAARPRRRLGRGDSRVPQAAPRGCRFPGGARGPASSGSPGPRAPPPRRATTASAAKDQSRVGGVRGEHALLQTGREAPSPRVPCSPRRTPRAEEAKKKAPSVVVAPAPPRRSTRCGAVARQGADGAPSPSPRPPSRPARPRRGVFHATPRRAHADKVHVRVRAEVRRGTHSVPPARRRAGPAVLAGPARTRRRGFRARSVEANRFGTEPESNGSVIRAAIPAARARPRAVPGHRPRGARRALLVRVLLAAFLRNAELRTAPRARAAVVPRGPQIFAAAFARAQARARTRTSRGADPNASARAARGEA